MSEEKQVEELKNGDIITPPATITEKKYSDEEVNALILKKQDKVLAKALADAGLASADELKALGELKKSKMTADEATAARLKELEGGNAAAIARAEKAEARAEIIAAGVPKDTADRVVKLALSGNYEGEMPERIAAIIAEFPEFVKNTGAAFGTPPKNETTSATDTLLEVARKQALLK